ncbi:MAG: DUF488 domain-containing protein [Desulfobacteraceae bacterium]|nr:MAG: DUF488 domain-containing protein [Desulfobacteraceae bacterium]
MHNQLYTIGYSPHTLDSFLHLLKKYQITALADVRSLPYSQYKPEFNKESFSAFLKANNIAYVFLGEQCGARVNDLSCYVNGKVDYNLVAKSQNFRNGLDRILKGMEKYRIVLMCAEKDPITCHRTILICRSLFTEKIDIKHILDNGEVEAHESSEHRLLNLYKLNQQDLFRSKQQKLDYAYSRQGEEIAYQIAEPSDESWGQ